MAIKALSLPTLHRPLEQTGILLWTASDTPLGTSQPVEFIGSLLLLHRFQTILTMSVSKIVAALASASLVAGHGYVSGIVANGK